MNGNRKMDELYRFTDLQDEIFFRHSIFLIQGLLPNKLVFISFYLDFLSIECLIAER